MDGSSMTCRESGGSLVAGIRGELDAPASDALARHLRGCPSCRGEDAAARRLADLLRERMPRVDPSPDGWSALRARIDAEATAIPTGRGRPLLLAAGGLAAAAAAVLLVLSLLPSSPSKLTPRLGILTVEGSPAAAGETLTLGAGAVIEAATLSRVLLDSRRRIDLTLAPGTRLVHEEPGTLRLLEGRLLADVRPGEDPLRIRTPSATAEVAGTLFQLTVAAGRTTLTVLRGEVILRAGAEPVRVPFGRSVTVSRGGVPGAPAKADPWRVRDWCSAPTALLEKTAGRLVLTLRNDTVSPLILRPFHPDSADYHLKVEGAGGPPAPLRIQSVMVVEGEHRPGDPDFLTLAPGEAYRLVLDPRLLGLSRGEWRVRAVYRPYKDLPASAWRGNLETRPRSLTID